MDAQYQVQIVERKTGKVEKTMPGLSFRSAERVQRGASINLDSKHYRVVLSPMPAVEPSVA